MKHVLTLLLVSLFVGCRITLSEGYNFDFQGTRAKRSDSGPISEEVTLIRVDNQFGDVEVMPATNGDGMWTWDLTVWSSRSEDAESWVEQITLRHDVNDAAAAWELVLPAPPARGLRGVKSNLVLSVPSSVEVQITNRGNVVARELAGNVEVRNRHGDVSVHDTVGVTELTNEHGRIVAERIGPATISSRHGSARVVQVSGDARVQSQHADVEVIGVSGEAIVESQHGDLQVTDVAGLVRVSNQHGAIKVQATPGSVRLENQHGSIELDSESVDVECRNQHGEVKLALTNPELLRLWVEGSHSTIRARLPNSLDGVRVEVEHGDISSAFPQAERSAFTFQTRHGDVRIERLGE